MIEKDGNLGLARGREGGSATVEHSRSGDSRRPAALLELSVLALEPLSLVLSSASQKLIVSGSWRSREKDERTV